MGKDEEVFLQWIQFPTVCKGYFPPGYFPPSPRWILSHTSHSEWKAETAFLNETTSFFAVFGQPGSPPCCMSCCSSVQPWNSRVSVDGHCGRRPWNSLCILLLKMGFVQCTALENRFTWQSLRHAVRCFQTIRWKDTTSLFFLINPAGPECAKRSWGHISEAHPERSPSCLQELKEPQSQLQELPSSHTTWHYCHRLPSREESLSHLIKLHSH